MRLIVIFNKKDIVKKAAKKNKVIYIDHRVPEGYRDNTKKGQQELTRKY